MHLLHVDKLTKYYGPEAVLDGASFDLFAGERLALVGPNGTGKTTLLKILAGQLDADSGKLEPHPSIRIGYLEQHPEFGTGRTLWEEASLGLADELERLAEVERLAAQIAEATEPAARQRLVERFDRLQQQIEHQGDYQLDYRIERVLVGLGFHSTAFQQSIDLLSGGQRNRLLLAKLLLAEPDVLLLDEPTNHLDIAACQWLENYLAGCRQAMVIVSHDRYLLDRVATRTLEVFRGTIDSFPGNFTAYWGQKEERIKVQRRTYENQQEYIAKTEDFIRRNNYGQKHAQAEDRKKKLARIERVEPPREIHAPAMGFPPASRSGDIVLRVEHVSKAFAQPLFHDVSFDMIRGQRWGILGPNGSGKTTLLRILMGREPANQGQVILGAGVNRGYYDQMLTALNPEAEVVEAVRPPTGEFNIQQRRDLLGRFGLSGDIVFQAVKSLSGGERSRVALAQLAATEPNLLILDEPTNHLDLWARDALERSLLKFDGSTIVVSHDRYFLNRVVDHLLVLDEGEHRVIDGNYDTYLMLNREPAPTKDAVLTTGRDDKAAATNSGRQADKATTKVKRKRRFPYRKVADIEADIMQRESRIEEIHELMIQPETLRDGDRIRQLQTEITEQQAALTQLYEHYEEAVELN